MRSENPDDPHADIVFPDEVGLDDEEPTEEEEAEVMPAPDFKKALEKFSG